MRGSYPYQFISLLCGLDAGVIARSQQGRDPCLKERLGVQRCWSMDAVN